MRAANAVRCLLSSLAALMAFAETTGSWERDRGCVLPMSQDVIERVERWQQAVDAGETAAIVASYSPDAILMGLGEHAIRLGRREITAHYTALLSDRVAVHTLSRVVEANCGVAVVTGVQRFEIVKNARVTSADVAYKMMFAYGEGDWMLIHHHLEPRSEFVTQDASWDVASVTAPTTGITTGTLPEAARTLTLPPPPFALPASPPVLLADQLPRVLSSSRPRDPTLPAVAADIQVTVPTLAIETGRFPIAAKATEPTPNVSALVVVVPALDIGIGAFPLRAAASAPPAAAPRVVGKATDVVVPRLGIEVGAFPVIARERVPAASAPSTPAPSNLASIDGRSGLQPSEPPPARPPAVASFAQRAAAAARPTPTPPPLSKPAKAQPAALKAGAAPPLLAKSKSSYKPVKRWNETIPVFDDN